MMMMWGLLGSSTSNQSTWEAEENQGFSQEFGYVASSRSAWAARDPVFIKKKKKNRVGMRLKR